MQPKLTVTSSRLSDADFLAKIGLIISSLSDNPHFPPPWPAPTPGMDLIRADRDRFHDAFIASQSRDTFKISQRKHERATAEDHLHHLASYLELIARGDAEVLGTTGYDLRHDIVRTSHRDALDKLTQFQAAAGPESGSVIASCEKVEGLRNVEITHCQTDPTQESNWQHLLISSTVRRIPITGLTPNQFHWFRARPLGKEVKGPWSEWVRVV